MNLMRTDTLLFLLQMQILIGYFTLTFVSVLSQSLMLRVSVACQHIGLITRRSLVQRTASVPIQI
jgi:hypothetical protein